jgi:hypothetical protein
MLKTLPRLLASLSITAAASGQDQPAAPAQAELPPYVVIPEPRPWESEAFRATELRFTIRGAVPSEARPSLTDAEAGLTRLERGSALVFHSPGRAELGAQVVDLLERQHRLLAFYTEQPFAVLPVAVVGTEENLPKPFGFWADIDGVTCWKLATEERALPLTNEGNFWADVGRSWLYHGTLHECCHHGACFDLSLMAQRWFCEGLSDYLGALAAVCYSPERDKASVAQWIEPLEHILQERQTINILSEDVWWGAGGGRLGGPLELAAYAASQYSMARLVADHGYDWIARVLKRAEAAAPRDADAMLAMIEAETGEKNLRARLEAVPLSATLAYLKQGLPQIELPAADGAEPPDAAEPADPTGPPPPPAP